MTNKRHLAVVGIVKSLGLVFGDIGTSPIYTLTVVFLILQSSRDNVIGVLSLIIWTMVVLVTIQYSWLAMRLSRRGEGGTIVLKELLSSALKSQKAVAFVGMLSIIGVSLLIGDSVITPAISILSAVEGSLLIPSFSELSVTAIVMISAMIALVLFAIQSKGTERVAVAFGPIMVIWFSSLAFLGLRFITEAPEVLESLNPIMGIRFLMDNKLNGFIVLGEVILCATGGEALYADMGHLGGRPIRQAWIAVFAALVLNYLGQGAYILKHPEAKNVLFEMMFNVSPVLYMQFLLLSILQPLLHLRQ